MQPDFKSTYEFCFRLKFNFFCYPRTENPILINRYSENCCRNLTIPTQLNAKLTKATWSTPTTTKLYHSITDNETISITVQRNSISRWNNTTKIQVTDRREETQKNPIDNKSLTHIQHTTNQSAVSRCQPTRTGRGRKMFLEITRCHNQRPPFPIAFWQREFPKSKSQKL